jgi:hypothetical protein
MGSMKAKVALLTNPDHRRTALSLGLLSVATLALPSMDQCTRGPSITAMVLTHLYRFL